ncbi:MAG: S8 family serine peptidase, partial [Gemella sp.]|nr:S8 family serine peptidase [Gemella sp.]
MAKKNFRKKIFYISSLASVGFVLNSPEALANNVEGFVSSPERVVVQTNSTPVSAKTTVAVTQATPLNVLSNPVPSAKPAPQAVVTNMNVASETKQAVVSKPAPVESTVAAPKHVETVTTATQNQSISSARVEKQSVESNEMINVQKLWQNDTKGQGTVVAVIDSGLDPEHDAFKLSDVSKGKYKSKEEVEAAMKAAGINYGKWYSDKVIYGFNYSDANDTLKEAETQTGSHGTHVSGIAVGNPSIPSKSGHLITGTAPEAQLMFMRVFSDALPGTSPFLYVRAIEDAVKLGADTINLSLGSTTGELHDMITVIDSAIERARQAGVTVVIASGNDTAFGHGHAKPDADKPDYGLVANPAVAKGAIAVASVNNTHVNSEVAIIKGMEQNKDFAGGKITFSKPNDKNIAEFPKGKEFDYVYVGLGKEEDFKDKDLTGKVALIKRGELTFANKINNAKKAGAEAVVIFNNNSDEAANFNMRLDDSRAAKTPAIFINQNVGEELAKNTNNSYKILLDGSFALLDNPTGEEMSAFTSWGLSADGELKPDITAPGGAIYSSINDNKYENQSGTSMAAPHVAGVAALVKQELVKKYPNLDGAELNDLIKNFMMSTANPHFNKETNAYTSPRQQGAGVVDASKAINTDVYLTGKDGYGSISLGNVDEKFNFDVVVNNLSNSVKKYKYVVNLVTDLVKDGKMELKPRALEEVPGGEITVEANGKLVLPISIDASKFTAELTEQMKNGYFLEGFVRLLDVTDGLEALSIPFVGFKGQFQDLAVMEKPIYDFKDGENPFYFTIPENKELKQTEDSDYTSLYTTVSEWDHLDGNYTAGTPITLGTFENEKGEYTIKRDSEGNPIFAISPNADDNRDSVILRAVFLRNFSDLKVAVYKADDKEFKNPVWQGSGVDTGIKNYFSNKDSNPKSVIVDLSPWYGKDQNGKVVADGDYIYRVSYHSVVPGSKEQSHEFKVTVDTVNPAVTTGVLDLEKRTFKPRPTIENGTGLYREQLYYVLEPKLDDDGEPIEEDTSGYDVEVSETKKVYLKRNEDGTYVLPEKDVRGDDLRIDRIYFNVEDHAGNIWNVNLADYEALGNEVGIVNFRLKDKETKKILEGVGFRYFIRDEQGNLVNEATMAGEGSHKMPFGKYTIEMLLLDEEYARIVGEKTLEFTVTEDNTLQAVDFLVEAIDYGLFKLSFDGALPEGSKVYVVSEDGTKEELPASKFVAGVYEKRLAINPYKVSVELPRAYESSKNNFEYVLEKGRNNVYLSLFAKGDLEKDGESANRPALEEISLEVDADTDGDGFTNVVELMNNSNPLDEKSVPNVSLKGESLTQPALEELKLPVVTSKG